MKKEIVNHWIEKAYRTLDSAKYNFQGEYLETTLDRLYYSAFYMIMAYLTLREVKFKKHSGVKSYFFQELVKKGVIDKKYGKLYNQLYYLREEADYSPNLKISKEKVKELLDETEMFMKNLERIIKNSI